MYLSFCLNKWFILTFCGYIFSLMERHLQIILNKVLKEHKDLLYGENSEIIVEKVDWIISKKSHIINVKIIMDDTELYLESHPDGINFLIQESLPILGRIKNAVVVSTVEFKD